MKNPPVNWHFYKSEQLISGGAKQMTHDQHKSGIYNTSSCLPLREGRSWS